jgi:hypothetical protein
MKIGCTLLTAALTLSALPAVAQPPSNSFTPEPHGIKCEDFRQNTNGSWTPVRKVTLSCPSGLFSVEPDEMFGIGPGNDASFCSLKIARVLNDRCR